MIRAKISNFIKKHEKIIKDVLSKLSIVAIVVFIATIVLSSFGKKGSNVQEQKEQNIYKPEETIQTGSDVSEEQYKADTDVVEKFMEYCNNKEITQAYNLISDECKEMIYPTIDIFKKNYYNNIFNEKREYNLQSWISTKEYTVYRIRYTNDLLSTGHYQEDNIYQDYITLIKDSSSERISIGKFVISEECNQVTNIDNMEITLIRKTKYIEEEEYEMYIKNKTDKTILLDNLRTDNYINLIGKSGELYSPYINKIFTSDITIKPGETKRINIKFKKMCTLNKESEYIQFSRVIKDYDEYIKDKENYNDTFKVKFKI